MMIQIDTALFIIVLVIIIGTFVVFGIYTYCDCGLEKKRIEFEKLSDILMQERCELSEKEQKFLEFTAEIRDCGRIVSGEKINIVETSNLNCEVYGLFYSYSVHMIRKGAQIQVLKDTPVIRHGLRNYRCVYINTGIVMKTEDDSLSFEKRPLELAHKNKFFLPEEELLRLKCLTLFCSHNIRFEEEKLKRMLQIPDRAE